MASLTSEGHPPVIRARGLTRVYTRGPQEIRAVDDIDLSIQAGEFMAVVGSSGSGKSTLLNLLAGLDTPTSGEVEVAGTQLSTLTPRGRAEYRATRVGMVFQSFNLIAHRTALQNVELALFFDGTPKAQRKERAFAMLTRLGLQDRTDHLPALLSGGEQQRVAIARALVKEPQLLFADEPTGNLDLENAQQIASLLTELNGDGITVILVTHDLELAARHASRTEHMHYGKMTRPGTASVD